MKWVVWIYNRGKKKKELHKAFDENHICVWYSLTTTIHYE